MRLLRDQKLPADQDGTQGKERFVDVGSLLVADAQSAKLVEPRKAPLNDPTPSAQSTTVLGVALREQRNDAAVTQTLPDWLRIITPVA